MTPAELQAATGCTPERAALFAPLLTDACNTYAINTPARLAAFLAQIGHESGALKYLREIWGPTDAQRSYEGRATLGNSRPGDGEKFMGRGLVQTTGRANYGGLRNRLRARLGPGVPDFEEQPELLELPHWAAYSAADYWDSRRLNALADSGSDEDFVLITRRVNGGLNGQADRVERWNLARAALGLMPGASAPQLPLSPQPSSVDQPTAPPPAAGQPERTMPLPLILSALLPSLIDAIPKLAGIFKPGSEVAERNVAGVQVAFDVVKQAIGAANEQEALEKIKADPAVAAVAAKAVEDNWYRLSEAGGGGIEGARKADAAAMSGDSPIWKSPSFLMAVLMMPLVYLLTGSVIGLYGAPWSDDVRAAIANGIIGMVLGGLVGYYFGQTTSRNRTPSA